MNCFKYFISFLDLFGNTVFNPSIFLENITGLPSNSFFMKLENDVNPKLNYYNQVYIDFEIV